jgi:hypothetical protein
VIYPCLLCNDPVIVDPNSFREMAKPVVVCNKCLVNRPPAALIKLVYFLRMENASLRAEVEGLKQDVRRLYGAQQELEQDYLRDRQERSNGTRAKRSAAVGNG